MGYAACRVRSLVPSIRQTASGEFNTPTAKGVKPTGPPIQQTPSGEFDLAGVESICQTRSGESGSMEPGRSILEDLERATTPEDEPREFLPQFGWGHYQELMRVENRNERHFYESEAAKEGSRSRGGICFRSRRVLCF